MAGDSAEKGTTVSMQIPVYAPFRPCALPASELQPMTISQMQPDTHHVGKRTIVRVITHPARHSEAVMGGMSDQEGKLFMLQLQSTCQPFEDIVPANQILQRGKYYLIKEPWARSGSDGEICLSVEHPGDIILLPDDHDLIPPKARKSNVLLGKSCEIRRKGNDAVGSKSWAEAEELYSAAIRTAVTAEEASLAYLNRSLANLRLGRPATALADAIKSNGTDIAAPTEKGLFREASALYDLAKYDQCLDRLQALKTAFPTNNSTIPMIDRVQARLNEQQTGQYDFSRMYKQARATPPLIDCATYNMPVEIRESPGKGRGVFIKKKVLAGELLICEKAFGYVYGGKDRPGRANMTVSDVHRELVAQIVQKLFHSIEDARGFVELYHGDYDVTPVDEVDGKPVIDCFLVSRIINETAHRSPRTNLSLVRELLSRGDVVGDQATSTTSGVWSFISHMNHSCISNVVRSFIGDMQIIRARRDLEAGEELLVRYEGPRPFESYGEMQKRLSDWDFACDCALCLDRKATADKVFRTRASLRARFTGFMKKGGRNLAKAQQVLDQLEQTYSPTAKQPGAVRFEVPSLCNDLCNVLTIVGKDPEAVIEVALKELEALGFIIAATPRRGNRPIAEAAEPELRVIQWGLVQFYTVNAFRALRLAYKIIAPQNALAAKGYMEVAYGLIVGESETILETYPEFA